VTGLCWEWAQWRGCIGVLGAVAMVSLGLALLASGF